MIEYLLISSLLFLPPTHTHTHTHVHCRVLNSTPWSSRNPGSYRPRTGFVAPPPRTQPYHTPDPAQRMIRCTSNRACSMSAYVCLSVCLSVCLPILLVLPSTTLITSCYTLMLGTLVIGKTLHTSVRTCKAWLDQVISLCDSWHNWHT